MVWSDTPQLIAFVYDRPRGSFLLMTKPTQKHVRSLSMVIGLNLWQRVREERLNFGIPLNTEKEQINN